MAPRWCITTTTRDGTCARSRRRAASAIMRRPGAGTGHRIIGGSTSIGAITSTGRGCAHPVPSISSMVMPSSGCMPPGTMEPLQPATILRTPGSSTDTPAPIAIATATDHDLRRAEARPERLPAGLVGPVRQQCRVAVGDLPSEPPIEAEQVMPDVANIDA
jgi:hypothetical protein